ncbi:hepatitis A virus cellular receptor 2 homolog [Pseudophryne corroboree]|uniref:hepatitis A virus cellular receptor 2 homolog n=1 Tax=Pseudophryne corroboree TaxID=495146 RepID=UPI0030820E2A
MRVLILWLSVLMCLSPALISAYRVTALEGDKVVLPCTYPWIFNISVCWGRGDCSVGCDNPIARVNEGKVSWLESDRYTFLGPTGIGVVSLTIADVTLADAGTYCCFAKIIKYDAEPKTEVSVDIQPALISAYRVTALEGEKVVLPCTYPWIFNISVCWGRGDCSVGCDNPIARVNEGKVSWLESDRYTFLGSTEIGVVSLTIADVTLADAGTYCCFAKIIKYDAEPKTEVSVDIQPASPSPFDGHPDLTKDGSCLLKTEIIRQIG